MNFVLFFFFFNDTATTEIYTLSLHDALPIFGSKWSAQNASGIQSLAWRGMWEMKKEEATKQLLLQYNSEDCLALQRVTEFIDRKSTRLNSSHLVISYAVFCLKKKRQQSTHWY